MEVSPEETDEECRAKIPPLLSQAERDALAYAPECRQRWGSRQTADATPLMGAEDIEEFRTEFAQLKENELALQCLFDSEFDVPRAVGLLHTGRRARRKAQNDQDERLQLEKFEEAIRTYDKKFHLVKKALGHKVLTREVVSKYYLWKSTEGFQEWRRRQKAKKKKEVERLYWGEDLESEKEARPNYHHDRCELCSTGGKLLCCDGCSRAYHFSCVQPPIAKVPDRDWFCVYCQEVMGSIRPKLIPSDDNEHCMVTTSFFATRDPDALTEASSVASSYEGEDSQYGDETGLSTDGNASDFPSTDEFSPDIDTLSDNGNSDVEGSKPSSSPPSKSPGRNQQSVGVAPQVMTQVGDPVQMAVEVPTVQQPLSAPPVPVRPITPMQLERSTGRKRQRKTLAPRRIPQTY